MTPLNPSHGESIYLFANVASDDQPQSTKGDQGHLVEVNDNLNPQHTRSDPASDIETSTQRPRGLPTDPPATFLAESPRAFSEFGKRHASEIDHEDVERKRARTSSGRSSTPVAEPALLSVITAQAPYHDISKLKKPRSLHCMVATQQDDESSIIGDISQAPETYWLSLHVDPGKCRPPSFKLQFTLEPAGEKQKQCSVTWHPGVVVDGRWMIDHFATTTLSDVPEDEAPHFKCIYRNCTNEDFTQVPSRMLSLTFQSGPRTSTNADKQDWSHLPEKFQSVMDTTFFGEDPFPVLIWVKPKQPPQGYRKSWVGPMEEYVNLHRRSLRGYAFN